MRGKNPFLPDAEDREPSRAYTITVDGKTIQVDPADLPDSGIGLRGALLSAMLGAGVNIDHACGGVLACSTCHVYVRKGLASCGDATEEEEDMLDQAPGLQSCSRLSCHTVPDGTADIVVEIPEWNRNAVKEGH